MMITATDLIFQYSTQSSCVL